MTISEYQTITGTTVSESKQTLYTAVIARTKRLLEDMLGYTLDPDTYDDNMYSETGKTSQECPCPSDTFTLSDPDAVVFAYRQYPYNIKDKFLSIDPCTAVHAVKLVKDNITYKTFEAKEYRAVNDRGIIRYLENMECCTLGCCVEYCDQLQLAVDATWLWSNGNIPDDLNDVWADMVTYYVDSKRIQGVRSETLGSHSYTKFDNTKPQDSEENKAILVKYAGPLGSVKRTLTL